MPGTEQTTHTLALGTLRGACNAAEDGSFARATKLAQRAIEAEPGSAEVRVAAAHLLFIARDYDVAFAVLRRAIELRLGRADQAAALGCVLAHRLNRPEERAEFLAICAAVDSPSLVLPRIADAVVRADYNTACSLAGRQARLTPRSAGAWLALAEAAASTTRDPADPAARKQVARAVKSALSTSRSPETVIRCSTSLAALGLVRAATSLLRQSYERHPDHSGLQIALERWEDESARAAADARSQLVAIAAAPPALEEIHADGSTDLAAVRALLDQMDSRVSDGSKPRRSRGADSPDLMVSAPELSRPLGESDLEHFIGHGWVRLPSVFSRETATAWRERAIRRIRTEPDECVRGYHPGGDAGDEHGVARVGRGEDPCPDLSSFDVEDPATWGRSRIDYSGELRTPYAEFSPRLWGAVDQLIGVDRLRTRDIGEYLVLNLSMGTGFEAEHDWASWHLDAPRTDMRFDNMQAGLLMVLLFSDIGPGMGATVIAPDSVGLVAQALAEGADGVDFVGHEADAEVMASATGRKFLEGDTGDAYLLHPLMLHSVSPNPSGVIRWMSNPILFLEGSLRTSGPGLTPVEEAIRRAVG